MISCTVSAGRLSCSVNQTHVGSPGLGFPVPASVRSGPGWVVAVRVREYRRTSSSGGMVESDKCYLGRDSSGLLRRHSSRVTGVWCCTPVTGSSDRTPTRTTRTAHHSVEQEPRLQLYPCLWMIPNDLLTNWHRKHFFSPFVNNHYFPPTAECEKCLLIKSLHIFSLRFEQSLQTSTLNIKLAYFYFTQPDTCITLKHNTHRQSTSKGR